MRGRESGDQLKEVASEVVDAGKASEIREFLSTVGEKDRGRKTFRKRLEDKRKISSLRPEQYV